MRYAFDTEFLEDGRTIELISIGVVAEDGREYYAVNHDFSWRRIARRRWWAPWQWEVRQPWLVDNVVSSLPQHHGDMRLHLARPGPFGIVNFHDRRFKSHPRIADEVRAFLLASSSEPELWADYCAYDHVVLCQLWGRMIDLPRGIPMWTHDFQQVWERAGKPELPVQASGQHNALGDAQYLMACMRLLDVAAPP